MRILADEYQGEVRFAYIISQKQEKLKEIFDVKTLPNTFLIEDGVAIEQNMLNVLYNQLYNFIEVGPKRDKQIYQSFPTPRVINDVELRIKYVYNYVFDKWHKDHGKDYTIGFLNTLKVPFTTGGGLEKDEEQNVWEIIEP